MAKGKEFWSNQENLKIEFTKNFNQKYQTNLVYEQIIPQYMDYAFDVLSEMYVNAVILEKVEYDTNKEIERICRGKAKTEYDDSRELDDVIFDELPLEEKNRLIDLEISKFNHAKREEIKEIETQKAQNIARLTIDRILGLQRENKIKKNEKEEPVITPFEILLNITTIPPRQEEYLVDSEYEKWLVQFTSGNIPRKSDGTIDLDAEIYVYCFQCGDLGASNFMKFDGNIGINKPGEGYFVFSESDYKNILNDRTLFDEQGKCNIKNLSARLGNVPLGVNPICIRRKVKLGDLKTSHGALETAYFGEFGPPLTTQGGYDSQENYIFGMHEAVVPSTTFLVNGEFNPDIQIISHSSNISTQEFNEIARSYLIRSAEFRAKENDSIDHWTLTNNLDKDIDILRRFKTELSKQEQEYLSKLMVYLQDAMVASSGGVSK